MAYFWLVCKRAWDISDIRMLFQARFHKTSVHEQKQFIILAYLNKTDLKLQCDFAAEKFAHLRLIIPLPLKLHTKACRVWKRSRIAGAAPLRSAAWELEMNQESQDGSGNVRQGSTERQQASRGTLRGMNGTFLKVQERPTVQTGCPQSARLSYGCCSARSREQTALLQGGTVTPRLLLSLALLRTCQTLKHEWRRTRAIRQQCWLRSKIHGFTKLTHGFTLPTFTGHAFLSLITFLFKRNNIFYLYCSSTGLFIIWLTFWPMSKSKLKEYSSGFQLFTVSTTCAILKSLLQTET